MRKTRELLRLRVQSLSVRHIADSVVVPRSTVADYARRIEEAGLSWPLGEDVDEDAVLRLLFGEEDAQRSRRPTPDWAYVHAERKRPGVTLQLLWLEYTADHAEDGYEYTQFCEYYHRWRKRLDHVLRQVHKAGEASRHPRIPVSTRKLAHGSGSRYSTEDAASAQHHAERRVQAPKTSGLTAVPPHRGSF